MKKSQIALLVVFFILFSNKSYSQVIGEYQGLGHIKTVVTENERVTFDYTSECTVSLNIDLTETSFEVPYLFYQCSGTTIENESLIAPRFVFKKINDSSYQATLDTSLDMNVNNYAKDANPCNSKHPKIIKSTMKLNRVWKFHLNKINNTTWAFKREAQFEDFVFRKEKFNSKCSYSVWALQAQNSILEASVQK